MFNSYKNILISLVFSSFLFACGGADSIAPDLSNDSGSNDTGFVVNDETQSNDSGKQPLDSGIANDSDSAKTETTGPCIPKTKDQIEKEFTQTQNEKTLASMASSEKASFGGYDQFIACGSVSDGCGGTIEIGTDVCPADPRANQDSGIVRTKCLKGLIGASSGVCEGTCGLLATSLSGSTAAGCTSSSFNIYVPFASPGPNGSYCAIKPRFETHNCYISETNPNIYFQNIQDQRSHICCNKY